MQATPQLRRDQFVVRSPDALMAEVDGETVLMSVEKGSYFGLAETAREIWARLEARVAIGDLCDQLVEHYDDPFSIETDTIGFLGRLAEVGLVVVE